MAAGFTAREDSLQKALAAAQAARKDEAERAAAVLKAAQKREKKLQEQLVAALLRAPVDRPHGASARAGPLGAWLRGGHSCARAKEGSASPSGRPRGEHGLSQGALWPSQGEPLVPGSSEAGPWRPPHP